MMKMIVLVNSLDRGSVWSRQSMATVSDERLMKSNPAAKSARDNLLREASHLAKVRRDENLTGAHQGPVLLKLLKLPLCEEGYVRTSAVKQVEMIADKMVEPSTSKCIPLLEVLPPDEAAFTLQNHMWCLGKANPGPCSKR